jgi:hypothetical protein
MKIRGKRVYLNMPEITEHKVSISPELKKQLQEEAVTKFDRLTVYAFGEGVEGLNVGDEVFVDPQGLRRGVVFKVEDKEKICVADYDIMHIY